MVEKCTLRPCVYLNFFVKYLPNNLNLHYETLIFVDDFERTHIYIWYSNKKLYSYKLVRPTKWSEKMHQVVQKESHKAAKTIYLEEKGNICVIYYVFKRMKSFSSTVGIVVF